MELLHRHNEVVRKKPLGLKLFLSLFLAWVVAGAFILQAWSRDAIFKFVNSRHHPFLDVFFKYYTHVGTAIVIVPVLLFLVFFYYRNKWFFWMFAVCQVPSLLINQGMKYFFDQNRPAFFYENQDWWHVVAGEELNYYLSFPSGHTAGAFAFFCLLSVLLSDKKTYFAVLFFFMALLVGYSRIYLSQHFYADVYAGSIEGVAMFLLMYVLYRWWIGRKIKEQ